MALSAQIRELVTLARNGDAEAFGELYELYYKEMYCYACCVTGSEILAQDAVSDAVLSAFQQIGSLRNERAFKGWLFTILRAACQNYYTAGEKTKSVVYIDDENRTSEEIKEESDFVISVELRQALDALADDEKEIVLLSTVGDYRSHEIAEILDSNPSTVRSKLKRALKKMRTYLDGEN